MNTLGTARKATLSSFTCQELQNCAKISHGKIHRQVFRGRGHPETVPALSVLSTREVVQNPGSRLPHIRNPAREAKPARPHNLSQMAVYHLQDHPNTKVTVSVEDVKRSVLPTRRCDIYSQSSASYGTVLIYALRIHSFCLFKHILVAVSGSNKDCFGIWSSISSARPLGSFIGIT